MRLLRGLFWLAATVALIWFAATVPLGRRTLLGHLLAIARTPEAKELAEGTKEQAKKMVERVREEVRADGGAPSPPAEELDDDDRAALERVIRERTRDGGVSRRRR